VGREEGHVGFRVGHGHVRGGEDEARIT
jgi:hypothetical protein